MNKEKKQYFLLSLLLLYQYHRDSSKTIDFACAEHSKINGFRGIKYMVINKASGVRPPPRGAPHHSFVYLWLPTYTWLNFNVCGVCLLYA